MAPVRLWPRWVLPGFALLLLGAGAVMCAADPALARRVFSAWGFRPFDVPFIDAEFVTANVRCWQQGVDVYAATPCDRLGRVFDYAPLWLRLRPLAQDWSWSVPIGLGEGAALALALAVLPVPRTLMGLLVMLAAVASPVCAFAVERGNPDVLMACLTAAALALLRRGTAARAGGWTLIGLAGALKFYPAVLGLMLLRERRAFALLTGLALALVGLAYLAAWHGEISRALANLPAPSMFSLSFGARFLPNGLGLLLGSRHLHRWLTPLMLVLAVSAAAILARRPAFAAALRGLPPQSADCLLAGALLVCGCFLSGPSVGYRGILLLFTLPGLLALRRAPVAALRWAAPAVLTLLWCALPMRLMVVQDSPAVADVTRLFAAAWLAREALWWGVVVVLLAVAWVMLADGARVLLADRARVLPADSSRAVPAAKPNAVSASEFRTLPATQFHALPAAQFYALRAAQFYALRAAQFYALRAAGPRAVISPPHADPRGVA